MIEPTDAEIFDACLSYRHDFGLMGYDEQEKLKTQAKEWLKVWQTTLELGASNISKSLLKSREEQMKSTFAPPSAATLIWDSRIVWNEQEID